MTFLSRKPRIFVQSHVILHEALHKIEFWRYVYGTQTETT